MKLMQDYLLAILLVGIIFISGCQQQTEHQTYKLLFSPPELLEATEGVDYSYSFCKPDSAMSDASCGGPAGDTINPTWGNPPYSFSHENGSGLLPEGLTLEPNGLLIGIPTVTGKYAFSVCAKDEQDEVCMPTTMIVKLKSAVKNETPQSPPPKPEIFDVKINEMSCKWTVKTGDYNVKSDCVRIISRGTAQGPVGARLELPLLAWSTDNFDCGNWTHKTGALIAVGSTCVRKEGQPETTNWMVNTGGDDCPTKNYFNSDRSHSVKIYKDNDLDPQKEDKRNTVCQ